MTDGARAFLLVSSVVILILALLFGFADGQPNAGFKDAAAALVVVSAVALGIERVVAMAWSGLDGAFGSMRPLKAAKGEVDALAHSLNSSLGPVFEQANNIVGEVQERQTQTQTAITTALEEIERLKASTAEFATNTKEKTQLSAYAVAATEAVGYLQVRLMALHLPAATEDVIDNARAVVQYYAEQELLQRDSAATDQQKVAARSVALAALDASLAKTPDASEKRLLAQNVIRAKSDMWNIGRAAEIANQAAVGVANFLGTFQNNPGRRVISLTAGVILGLFIAAALSLDLFAAVLDGASTSTKVTVLGSALEFRWGVVLTGAVLGLGASPTHEVVKILQESKQTRKITNSPRATDDPIDSVVGIASGLGSGVSYMLAAPSPAGYDYQNMAVPTSRVRLR